MSETLLTVSMADIPVLHSIEIVQLYPQVVLPICHGIMNPIRLYRDDDVALRGLSKVPLVRENLLQCQEEGSMGIPCLKSFTDSSTREPPYSLHRHAPHLFLSGMVISS